MGRRQRSGIATEDGTFVEELSLREAIAHSHSASVTNRPRHHTDELSRSSRVVSSVVIRRIAP